MAKLSEALRERGYVYQFSSETLEEITDGSKRTVYLGIDPSADSLHVGNLVGLLVLRRFLEDGHRIIILTGGGTGMIGDPGGRSEERNLLDAATVERNTRAVAAQIRQVFGSGDFIEVDNAAWLSGIKLLEFLRDVGKHFTVNAMIKKDIVRDRLEKESPISFTEFSYSLLQGYDFLHLNEEYSCDVQVGGSDQWSNILAGVDFVRRKADRTVYAFTWPLIINKATGKKFGKSEAGAIWLDSSKTSPFAFYQFWINSEDEAVEEYLLKMTTLSMDEIAHIMRIHTENPGARHAQRSLAMSVTALVHGAGVAAQLERTSDILFGSAGIQDLTLDDRHVVTSLAPSCVVHAGDSIVDVLVSASLAASKREARQFLETASVTLNGASVQSDAVIDPTVFVDGAAILRRGKRSVALLTLVQS